jgi:glycosyltransferase involved in cell wall biosynthesis
MRILQVAKKVPWPARDGESIAILNLTRGFARAGHEVTVLAMNTPKHRFDPGYLPDEVRDAADVFTVDVDTSVRPVPALLNLLTRSSYNLERFFSRDFQEGLRRLLREREFDLIQLEGLYLAPYHRTIRSVTRAPIVLRAHNVEFEIWEKLASGERHPLKRAYFRLLARRLRRFEVGALNAYDALVPISPADEARFRALGASGQIHTCPVGLQPDAYRTETKAATPGTIGFLGALDWMANREGIDWFLDRVWPAVLAARPEARLSIAGRNAPPGWPGRERPGVAFVGEVEDARDFLAAQSVVVVPLLSGSGMRIKVLEALALGRPLVATRLAVEGIAMEDGRHAVLRDDPEAYARALIGLLDDPSAAEAMGREGQRLVRDAYDLENVVYGLLEFYHRLLPATAVPQP